jgi:hypothetical protein
MGDLLQNDLELHLTTLRHHALEAVIENYTDKFLDDLQELQKRLVVVIETDANVLNESSSPIKTKSSASNALDKVEPSIIVNHAHITLTLMSLAQLVEMVERHCLTVHVTQTSERLRRKSGNILSMMRLLESIFQLQYQYRLAQYFIYWFVN